MCKLTIKRNEEKNGVELYFDQKPAQAIIEQIKAAENERGRRAFRYHRSKKCWYAKASEKVLLFVRDLNANPIPAAKEAAPSADAALDAIWAEFGQA